MKLALTLLLVGIAQSQTLLNTLRNLGAADSSFSDGTSTGTYCSEEEKKTIYTQAADGIEAIDAKVTEDINANIKAIEDINASIKTILAKAVEDRKAIHAKATKCNQPKYDLQQLLMQEPKGTQGFIPTKYALDTLKKIGGLNYQKLVDDNIVEEPTQPVTIKLNFKRKIIWNKYFEFAQMNLDGQLHGFARYINEYGSITEAEFRNGKLHGFQRSIRQKRFSTFGDFGITWQLSYSTLGQLSYFIDYNTPSQEWQSSNINAKDKEAFAKFKKNGSAYYFTKY